MRKNMNVPNILTLSRIAAIPAVVLLMYYRVWHPEAALASQLACGVFAIACITDLVDGHIARSYKVITNLGKFLDPLADKLLILSALIMLVRLEWAPAWVVIIILARELSVTGMRAMAADEGVVIAADKFGKLKTLTQSFAIGILIWNVPLFGMDLNPLGMILLYIALALTVFSGINYFRNYLTG
ncbi:MAG: CDP-diacylglycerol--glycerol-3-phosphate 3-phosphatidyltransferase [Armatimonadota bacterium]